MSFHLIIMVFDFFTSRHPFLIFEKKKFNFWLLKQKYYLSSSFHFFFSYRGLSPNHHYKLLELLKLILLHTQVASISNLDHKVQLIEKHFEKLFFIIFLKEAFRAIFQKCTFACQFKQKYDFFQRIKIDV